MNDFLRGPDEDGVDALDLELDSLGVWLDVAKDPSYDIEKATAGELEWRGVSAQLAERALALGQALQDSRDLLPALERVLGWLEGTEAFLQSHGAHSDAVEARKLLERVREAGG